MYCEIKGDNLINNTIIVIVRFSGNVYTISFYSHNMIFLQLIKNRNQVVFVCSSDKMQCIENRIYEASNMQVCWLHKNTQ